MEKLLRRGPLAALEVVLPAHGDDIALLLTDVVMPQMSGPDLAEKMTESLPALKTIFMRGYTDEKLASRVITHRLLRKPFGSAELLRTLREALNE